MNKLNKMWNFLKVRKRSCLVFIIIVVVITLIALDATVFHPFENLPPSMIWPP